MKRTSFVMRQIEVRCHRTRWGRKETASSLWCSCQKGRRAYAQKEAWWGVSKARCGEECNSTEERPDALTGQGEHPLTGVAWFGASECKKVKRSGLKWDVGAQVGWGGCPCRGCGEEGPEWVRGAYVFRRGLDQGIGAQKKCLHGEEASCGASELNRRSNN